MILRSCPTIESLLIRKFVAKQQTSLFPLEVDFARVASQTLRKLTLFPTTESRLSPHSPDSWLSCNITLQALEVLCLRSITIPDNFTLPNLPRLHTLQIIQTAPRFPHGRGDIRLYPRDLPLLRTLDLYQNMSELNIGETILSNLKRLSIVGRKELQLPHIWGDSETPPLPKLTNLTYGVTWYPVPNAETSLSDYGIKHISWRSLESIHVVVWSSPQYGEAWSTSHRVLQAFIRRLEIPGDSPRLREVAILKDISCDSPTIPLADEVRAICASRGISYLKSDSESAFVLHPEKQAEEIGTAFWLSPRFITQ